ncbi:MAG TPA: transposase [Tepidisphaeraceae bacterium]|jgi:hypothetical protein|nr:transposase [Tepidisphaeraceae bacterium]
MLAAWHLAGCKLRRYYNKYSRHDFTLPQLFACLVVRELLRLSYRKLEQFLQDSAEWIADLGMSRMPDHNTLCRAAARLLQENSCKRLLDEQVKWAIDARMLRLCSRPLAIDSSMFESHHVSRHYELRRSRMARMHKKPDKSRRKRTVQSLPKLAVAVDSHSHLALSFWTGTGLGSDSPHFEKLLFDAWRRVPNQRFTVVADAGYDAEHNHRLARNDMNLRSIIPATIGRKPASDDRIRTRWRRRMRAQLASKRSRRRCGYTQRWQAETANSMMKRNLGSALRGKTNASRMSDLRVKVLTHNLMILR